MGKAWRLLLSAVFLIVAGAIVTFFWKDEAGNWGISIAVFGGLLLLFGCLFFFPEAVAGTELDTIPDAKEKLTIKNEIRGTLVQALLGAVILLGVVSTWHQLLISRNTQITEQFTGAVEQLSDETIQVRLGAIYTLERLTRTAEPNDRLTVYQLLAAYVKARSPWPPRPLDKDAQNRRVARYRPLEIQSLRKRSPDVQAALDVIGSLKKDLPRGQKYVAFLTDVDLRGAELLSGAVRGSALNGASLEGADLRGAVLDYANARVPLEKPHPSLRDADLRGASLRCAELQGADFTGAKLQDVDLRDANLRAYGDRQVDAKFSEDADLTGVRWNNRTLWPKGFDPMDHGARPAEAPLTMMVDGKRREVVCDGLKDPDKKVEYRPNSTQCPPRDNRECKLEQFEAVEPTAKRAR
jgi:hypothetical protein